MEALWDPFLRVAFGTVLFHCRASPFMTGHPIMKLSHFVLALVCLSLSSVCFAAEGVADLSIGASAPDFELPGIDGKTYRLADFQDGKVLVVFFTSNHCPTSHGAADRLKTFLADYRPQGVEFVAINPNHPDGLSIDELGYSKYGLSLIHI